MDVGVYLGQGFGVFVFFFLMQVFGCGVLSVCEQLIVCGCLCGVQFVEGGDWKVDFVLNFDQWWWMFGGQLCWNCFDQMDVFGDIFVDYFVVVGSGVDQYVVYVVQVYCEFVDFEFVEVVDVLGGIVFDFGGLGQKFFVVEDVVEVEYLFGVVYWGEEGGICLFVDCLSGVVLVL